MLPNKGPKREDVIEMKCLPNRMTRHGLLAGSALRFAGRLVAFFLDCFSGKVSSSRSNRFGAVKVSSPGAVARRPF